MMRKAKYKRNVTVESVGQLSQGRKSLKIFKVILHYVLAIPYLPV